MLVVCVRVCECVCTCVRVCVRVHFLLRELINNSIATTIRQNNQNSSMDFKIVILSYVFDDPPPTYNAVHTHTGIGWLTWIQQSRVILPLASRGPNPINST